MNPLDSSELLKARDRLAAGDVVAVPTETVYGLAASIESEAGLRKIFALKERPFFDPLIVHVASLREAQALTKEWPPVADFLARVFWPGPLTLVLPKAPEVSSLITSGLDTVAIRYPSHPLMIDLIRLLGQPLAAPSANKFGRTSPSTAAHVRAEFPGGQLLVVDGGECEVGVESTVIDFRTTADGQIEIRILRPGGVTKEMIEKTLLKWSSRVEVVRAESAASPGHTPHHYMPAKPLAIVAHDEPRGLSLATRTALQNSLKIRIQQPLELELSEEPEQAARELYSEMRRVSESGADLLYVRARENLSEENAGLWSAIWDRLTRAASLDLRPKNS